MQYYNATSCMCSRVANNQYDLFASTCSVSQHTVIALIYLSRSDPVQCFNASIGPCRWTEHGRCGWPYNPSVYQRIDEEELALLPDPPICGYDSRQHMEWALEENGTHAQGTWSSRIRLGMDTRLWSF